jgi:hypothetical protein
MLERWNRGGRVQMYDQANEKIENAFCRKSRYGFHKSLISNVPVFHYSSLSVSVGCL